MESETEGGVLDIHFVNKTDVDLCRISLVERAHLTTVKMTGCMSTTPTAAMGLLLQLVVEKEARQVATDCTAPTSLKSQTGDISKLL
jgi:hypothetical protein